MKFKTLCLKLAELEGKKKQVNIAQISELVSKLRKIVREEPSALIALLEKPRHR